MVTSMVSDVVPRATAVPFKMLILPLNTLDRVHAHG